jgi:histidine ammonia-lyase
MPEIRHGVHGATSVLLFIAGLTLSVAITAISASEAVAQSREVILLTGSDLTLDDVVKIAENRADVAIAPAGMARIEAARKVIQHYVDAKIPAYGVNTMYGQDFGVILPTSEIKRINRINLFQEATKIGDGSRSFIDPAIIRATWGLLVNSYAKGLSGVSPGLAETIVARVNANDIPEDIEYGGSMGGADLIMNAKLAVALYDKPGFEVGAGEATPLLTYNFLTITRAILAAKRFERLLPRAKVSLGLSMEGYRANPSPISKLAMKATTLASKRKVQGEMQLLLKGSKLWEKGGPRRLQDFLSMRTSADMLAAVEVNLIHLKHILSEFCNALQVSPMVDVQENKILSVTEWDTTELTLDLDHFRQALALMAIQTNSRALKVMSRPYSDLPSGLSSGDALKFDGLYTRNITYWMNSLMREALQHSQPVTDMTGAFIAEGDEDYYIPFPNSASMAHQLVDRLEKIVTIEALIGSFALERRLQAGTLKEKDVAPLLRTVQKEIIQRSPMQIPVDAQYSFAALIKYFIEEYQPPKEVSQLKLPQ